MKKIISVLVLAVVCLTAVASSPLAGPKGKEDKTVEKRIKLTGDFSAIRMEGPYDVVYEQGSKSSVTIKGDEKAVKRAIVTLEDSTLKITEKERGTFSIKLLQTNKATIYVTSPRLSHLANRGDGDFRSNVKLDTDEITILLQGRGDVEAGSIACEKATIKLTGTGDLEIEKLTADDTDIMGSGTGSMKITFSDANHAKAVLDGTGSIDLRGRLETFKQEKNGTGKLITRRLTVRDITEE